jgi:hypothetical protein
MLAETAEHVFARMDSHAVRGGAHEQSTPLLLMVGEEEVT